MDYLFPLILVIIAILSAIAKAKPKAKIGAKPAASGELQKKLKAFFADIQEKFETQTQKGTSGSLQWRHLAQGSRGSGSPADPYEMSLEDLVLEDAEPSPAPGIKPPLPPAEVQDEPSVIKPAGRKQDLTIAALVPATAAQDRAFLRQAVIWSEILGPPVALRDFPGER